MKKSAFFKLFILVILFFWQCSGKDYPTSLQEADAIVNFSQDNSTVAENAGAHAVTVQLSRPLTRDVAVPFQYKERNAKADRDFKITDSSITILAGQLTGIIRIQIIDDSTPGADRSFSLSLQTPTGAGLALGAIREHQVKIMDNDSPAQRPDIFAGFATAQTTTTEGAQLQIDVSLSQASDTDVSVNWQAVSETALENQDYLISSLTLVIPAGSLLGRIQIPIQQDSVAEFTESFQLQLISAAGAKLISGKSSHSIVILDDDPIAVQFSATSGSAREGDVVPIRMEFSGGAPEDLVFSLATGGTANSFDYTLSSREIIVPAGSTSASFQVTLMQDNQVEADETIVFQLSVVSGRARVEGISEFTLSIVSADLPLVNFMQPQVTLTEGGRASITVLSSQAAPFDITVPFQLGNSGSASAADIMMKNASGQVVTAFTIPANTTSGVLELIAVDDTFSEGTENLPMTLQPGAGYLPGSSTQFHISILDNDNYNAVFRLNQSSLIEGEAVTLVVDLDTSASSPLVIPLAITGDTSRLSPASTWSGSTAQVTIASGSNSGSLVLGTVKKPDFQPNQTLSFRISDGNGISGVSGRNSYSLTVADDLHVLVLDDSRNTLVEMKAGAFNTKLSGLSPRGLGYDTVNSKVLVASGSGLQAYPTAQIGTWSPSQTANAANIQDVTGAGISWFGISANAIRQFLNGSTSVSRTINTLSISSSVFTLSAASDMAVAGSDLFLVHGGDSLIRIIDNNTSQPPATGISGTISTGKILSNLKKIQLDDSGRIYLTAGNKIIRMDDAAGTGWSELSANPDRANGNDNFGTVQAISWFDGHLYIFDKGNGNQFRLVRVDDISGANWKVIFSQGTSVSSTSSNTLNSLLQNAADILVLP